MFTSILTIGYGNRSAEEFFGILNREGIQFLIDVRSNPVSRFNADFSAERLSEKLRLSGIRYVLMGDTLAGVRRTRPAMKTGMSSTAVCRKRPSSRVGLIAY